MQHYRLKPLATSLTVIFLFVSNLLFGQAPRVPSTVSFADMTLQLNPQAQRDIQLEVDALCRNPSYFKVKLERVDLYMPLIERTLKEEGVPEDLKYLVIQESGLIPDAVSTSNAVGFWQFKKGTAQEVFLQVDHLVDERKNIVSSTRGAATYLKKHNNYFDNWVCALVSYQMGLGGAKNYFGSQFNGVKSMKITQNTYWYFKKFLAHKIAFENHIGKNASNQHLEEIAVQGPVTLAELSRNLGVSESHLQEYNKWVSGRKIPEGKTYSLTYLAAGAAPLAPTFTSSTTPAVKPTVISTVQTNHAGYPKVSGTQRAPFEKNQVKINGIKGIIASINTTQEDFAERIGISEGKFRRINDLDKSDRINKGNYYYTKRKKGKAKVATHVVAKGETLWSISQAYGIRLHSLKAKNRLYKDTDLRPGMVLKLQEYRGRNEEIRYQRAAPPYQAPPQPTTTPATTPASVPNTSGHKPSITHTVVKGETLYAIAKRYGVSVGEIQQWNNFGNQTVIKIGQQLIIKKD